MKRMDCALSRILQGSKGDTLRRKHKFRVVVGAVSAARAATTEATHEILYQTNPLKHLMNKMIDMFS